MKKAFLNYVINSSNGIKKMIVEADSLDYIDSITSKYNNDFEFIKASNKKLKIIDFIKENGNKKGKLEIEYAIDINQKIDLPVFYNYPNRIVLDDDFMNNDVSEIEKARKLLFNSKNQLFARIALLDRSIMDTLSYKVSISYPEYLYAKSKKLNTSRNILNILGLVSIGLLYLTSILIVAIALVKPSYDDMFTNHKTGIWYGFSQILTNTNGTASTMAEATTAMNKVYTSNLQWGLNTFGIVVIALTCVSLVYTAIVCVLFKLNNFYFGDSKSLTVWNLGLPITLVVYSFILAMLATPFNDGTWTITITKNNDAITTSINAVNGPVLDVSNYFSLAIDATKVINGGAGGGGAAAMTAATTTNRLMYNGSLESNYASGSMSILLGAILVYAIAITFVTKLSIKLDKEFKGVVEQQPEANI